MSFDVSLYDDTMAAVSSTSVEVVENTDKRVLVDLKTNGPTSSGSHGVSLALPALPTPINIWVDDPTGYYAPAGLGRFHGGLSQHIDAVIYPLPAIVAAAATVGVGGGSPIAAGGGGKKGRPSHPSDPMVSVRYRDPKMKPIRLFRIGPDGMIIPENDADQWSDAEIMGLRTLASTIALAQMLTDVDPAFDERVSRWQHWLRVAEQFGFDAKDASGSGRGSSGRGGSGSSGVDRIRDAAAEMPLRGYIIDPGELRIDRGEGQREQT
jgi:hypothetical protein